MRVPNKKRPAHRGSSLNHLFSCLKYFGLDCVNCWHPFDYNVVRFGLFDVTSVQCGSKLHLVSRRIFPYVRLLHSNTPTHTSKAFSAKSPFHPRTFSVSHNYNRSIERYLINDNCNIRVPQQKESSALGKGFFFRRCFVQSPNVCFSETSTSAIGKLPIVR